MNNFNNVKFKNCESYSKEMIENPLKSYDSLFCWGLATLKPEEDFFRSKGTFFV